MVPAAHPRNATGEYRRAGVGELGWFCNHRYSDSDYMPDAAGRGSEWDQQLGDQWRTWRDTLWAAFTGRSGVPAHSRVPLPGCDFPDLASLRRTQPELADQARADWPAFQRWWRVAHPRLAEAGHTPAVVDALREARAALHPGHRFGITVVGLRAAQTLAESRQHRERRHHAIVSLGMLTAPDRFGQWLSRTVAAIRGESS